MMERFIAYVDTDPQNPINKMLAIIDTAKSESKAEYRDNTLCNKVNKF